MADPNVRIEWYGKQTERAINQAVRERVTTATQYLRSKVRSNISVPVKKTKGPRGGIRKERSKPGEFPRRDTGALKKNVFGIVQKNGRGIWDGYVGNTVDVGYSYYLEMKDILDRSYLERTLNEELQAIRLILIEPM